MNPMSFAGDPTPPPPCGYTTPTTPGHSGMAHHHSHVCDRPTVETPHPGNHHCGGCGATYTGTGRNPLTVVPTMDEHHMDRYTLPANILLPMVECHACGTQMPRGAVRTEYDDHDEVDMHLCMDTDACSARIQGKQSTTTSGRITHGMVANAVKRHHAAQNTQGGGVEPGQERKDGPTPGRPFLSREVFIEGSREKWPGNRVGSADTRSWSRPSPDPSLSANHADAVSHRVPSPTPRHPGRLGPDRADSVADRARSPQNLDPSQRATHADGPSRPITPTNGNAGDAASGRLPGTTPRSHPAASAPVTDGGATSAEAPSTHPLGSPPSTRAPWTTSSPSAEADRTHGTTSEPRISGATRTGETGPWMTQRSDDSSPSSDSCSDPNPSAQWVRCRREAGHDGWHESLGVSWAVATGARRPQTVSDVQTPQPDPENPPTVATAGRAADSDDWPGVPTAMDMDAAVRNGWVDVGAGTLEATGSELDRDLIDKVNAGAALVYALYHDHGRDGSDDRWWKVVGDPVMDGYHKACEAYEVGRPRVTVDPEAGRSADDAVRCQYTALGSRCVRDADHQGSHKTVHRPARPQDFNVGRCMETNARGRQCYRDHGHEGNHQ